ncbi:MAG: GGDEF domain-containing protein [Campylobacterota bacterium]|nr:GGDEF domain-containing protein [Campylobacterota bacterium]
MLNKKWEEIISKVNFAYQPIVNIRSGKTYAVEVFLRNYKEAGGFYSIANFFDEAYNDGILYQVDLYLRVKVLQEFKKIDIQNLRLFYNIDYRIMNMPDFTVGNTAELFNDLNMDTNLIFFEISEKSTLKEPNIIRNLLSRYKQEGYSVAIDNFATGVSGFQLLYYPNCDFIKLDRMFIDNIAKDIKKRLFFSSIIKMAHIMNIKVIALCVETIDEYYVCKDMGVDFIQGYFIKEPSTKYTKIESSYKQIKELYKSDKRDSSTNNISKDKIKKIPPLYETATLEELFLYFKVNSENHFVPIIDSYYTLLGAVYEKDIKKMSYSQYGMSLAKNANMEASVTKYMKSVVSAEISWSIDKILDIYNLTKIDKTGIFITRNNEYYGFVDLNNLLELSYFRSIEIARDQNPLTKLPGNSQIEKYINNAFLNKDNKTYHIVYFDFNDFKPFNDTYGFRQGDRAITMFAQILKKELSSKQNTFIGHIGGDDFFCAFGSTPFDKTFEIVNNIQKEFRDAAASLYNAKDRENGYIKSKDRFGIKREFDLLDVAAAIIEINSSITKKDFDDILNGAKKAAKNSKTPIGITLF